MKMNNNPIQWLIPIYLTPPRNPYKKGFVNI